MIDMKISNIYIAISFKIMEKFITENVNGENKKKPIYSVWNKKK